MKTPRYADLHRYPNGYRKSAETDVKRTFTRIRATQAKKSELVTEIKRGKVASLRQQTAML